MLDSHLDGNCGHWSNTEILRFLLAVDLENTNRKLSGVQCHIQHLNFGAECERWSRKNH